ncbi:MAG TPA: ABC transporter permease [Bryobacteraceae bacterium]|nr:ABC transporter permease [Bryobacteraceae bacterium]
MTTLKDLRFALRLLRKNWTLTAIAVVTLAVGIAINATVFSWIDSVRFHPFPGVRDPDELALIETVTPAGEILVSTSYLDYRDYRDILKLVSGLAIGRFTPLSMGSGGRTERAWAELVSANFFDVLGVKPELGRTFLPEEGADKPGAFPVAVISHRLWKSHFQGDPRVLGKTIRLNRQEITIIGVAPPAFRGTTVGLVYDVWMPITMATAMGTGNGTLNYRATRDLTSAIARLKPGVTIEQAGAEAAALARRLAGMYPETNRGVDATMVPVWAGHLGAQGLLLKPLRILMAVSLLLLLIGCANVANLLLARAVTRQKEFGIRLAMGAHAARVARQLLTETLVLAAVASGLGAILVMWMGQSLALLLPSTDLTLDTGGGLNPDTLGFTLLIAVVATLISGTAPAVLAARGDLSETLKEGGRSGTFGRHSHRLRSVLVFAEVGLAAVALIGAGLFFRSFQNASGIRPGFDMSNISSSQFYLSYAGYSADEQRRFCRMLRQRMEAIPGVIGVTYTDYVPLGAVAGTSPINEVDVPGYAPAPNEQMLIHRATAPPGYFDLLHIPLLEGRDFAESDDETKPVVIIVNQTFARRYFRGADPVGRNMKFGNQSATVVGVVKDSKYHVLTEAPIPFFYIPFRQWFAPGLNFSVLLKTAGDPMRLEPVLRREALALNQDAVFHTTPLAELATASLYPQRVAASLLTVVGMACVLLAGLGLYSVMSYAVSQRTQELGIRMALGAQPANVRGLMVREGLRLTLPGLVAGVAAAALAARTVGGMLVAISSFDPLTFTGAVVFLALVAMLASYMPARRATRLDPMLALRRE